MRMCRYFAIILLVVKILTLASGVYAAGSVMVKPHTAHPFQTEELISQPDFSQEDYDRNHKSPSTEDTSTDPNQSLEPKCYEDEACEEFYVVSLFLYQWLGETSLEIVNACPAAVPTNHGQSLLRPPIA